MRSPTQNAPSFSGLKFPQIIILFIYEKISIEIPWVVTFAACHWNTTTASTRTFTEVRPISPLTIDCWRLIFDWNTLLILTPLKMKIISISELNIDKINYLMRIMRLPYVFHNLYPVQPVAIVWRIHHWPDTIAANKFHPFLSILWPIHRSYWIVIDTEDQHYTWRLVANPDSSTPPFQLVNHPNSFQALDPKNV